jgi:excisionase family DNA binding protein
MKTVKEVAQELKLSEITIRRWVKDKKIKSVKISRFIRIPKEELDRLKKGE